MKALKFLFIGVLALLIAFLLFHFFGGRKERDVLTLFGNVDIRQVDLGFRVSGRVEKLYFQEGDFVPTGELMASLERQPYLDEFLQAEADLLVANRSLANAELLLKRRQELVGDGSISVENLQDAMTTRDVDAGTVKAKEAALGVALKNLKDTDFFSPSDGTILTRIREPGSVVSPTQPVYTLSIISPLWIRAYVSEPDLGNIYPGMEGEVHTDTEGAPIYKGKIGFISPVAEFTPKTVQTTSLRTDLVYRIRLYVDNPGSTLKQGMPVTIKLPLKSRGG